MKMMETKPMDKQELDDFNTGLEHVDEDSFPELKEGKENIEYKLSIRQAAIRIEEDLWDKVKQKCVLQEISIGDYLANLVREDLRLEKPKEKKKMKFKVKVSAYMEFEIESENEYSTNDDATNYVESHKEELDWSFDEITPIGDD